MNLSHGGREIEFSNAPATLTGALLRKSHQANGDRGKVLSLKNMEGFPSPLVGRKHSFITVQSQGMTNNK